MYCIVSYLMCVVLIYAYSSVQLFSVLYGVYCIVLIVVVLYCVVLYWSVHTPFNYVVCCVLQLKFG